MRNAPPFALAPPLLSGVFLLLASAGGARDASAGEPGTLQQALEKARADLEAEQEALAEDRRRFENQEAKLRERIEAILARCETTTREIEQARKDLETADQRHREAEAEQREARSDEADLRRLLFEKIEALQNRVKVGVPHGERGARLEVLERLRETVSEPGFDLPHAMEIYLRQAIEEIRLGASRELYDTSVTTDEGRRVEATCFRIGKIFQAYRSAGGDHAALLVRGVGEEGGYTWKESGEAGDVVQKAIRSETGVYRLPMDVTLDISADRLSVSKDLLSTLASGGLVMIPLGLVALAGILLVLERALVLTLARPRTRQLEREVIGRVREGDPEGATEAAGRIRGPAASVLHAGLSARAGGRTAVEEAVEERAVRALPGLERFLSAIAALAAIAPLLGLLGTVTGMIATFDVITLFGTGDPRLLSGGISEALITTQVGLIIAVPLLLLHRILAGAVERSVTSMETLGVALVNALYHGSPAAAPEEAEKAEGPKA